jgi:hypothetical protein
VGANTTTCSQELLETLFGRQLLDVRTFGMWLRDSLQDVTFVQLPFVLDQLTRLATLVYEDLMVGTCIVAAAVCRLHEVYLFRLISVEEISDRSCFQVVQHRARSALQSIERRLVESIKVCFQPSLHPDADIS